MKDHTKETHFVSVMGEQNTRQPDGPSQRTAIGTNEVRGLPCFDLRAVPYTYRYIGSVGNARSIYTCWKKGLKRIVRRLLSCCTPQDKKFKICIARLPVLKKNKADCKDVVKSLDSYFIPKINVPFERRVSRQMKQQSHEKVDQFVCRLRQGAITCEFLNVDETIRDQRIEKYRDGRLRR